MPDIAVLMHVPHLPYFDFFWIFLTFFGFSSLRSFQEVDGFSAAAVLVHMLCHQLDSSCWAHVLSLRL